MARRNVSIHAAFLASSILAWPAMAADVTPERLLNADKEPQNWLMNHRTYDGQRFSPLARISRDNVKSLKLAYAVPLGGGAGNEFSNATPLAEDGFLYVTDSWNVLYKIDARSGDVGRIVWRMDPKQDRQMRSRGAALWGNLVVTGAGGFGNSPRIIATDKETGKVVWETSFSDTPDVTFTAAPLAIKDKLIVGAANGDTGVRDWIAGLDAATGKRLWQQYTIPAPGEPGSETWKGNTNAWQTGGGAVWVTGTYDPATNQTIWGTGNPVPMFDPTYRPGDNLGAQHSWRGPAALFIDFPKVPYGIIALKLDAAQLGADEIPDENCQFQYQQHQSPLAEPTRMASGNRARCRLPAGAENNGRGISSESNPAGRI